MKKRGVKIIAAGCVEENALRAWAGQSSEKKTKQAKRTPPVAGPALPKKSPPCEAIQLFDEPKDYAGL